MLAFSISFTSGCESKNSCITNDTAVFAIDAKVSMKHFEEEVKKVREQKDLKLGEKLVASYYR